jgi:hypothetical protein
MNPGKSALTPIAAGFFRWNATPKLHTTDRRFSAFGSFRPVREPGRAFGFHSQPHGAVVREMRMAGRRQGAQGRGKETDVADVQARATAAWTKRSKTFGEFMAVKKPAAGKKGRQEAQKCAARAVMRNDRSQAARRL